MGSEMCIRDRFLTCASEARIATAVHVKNTPRKCGRVQCPTDDNARRCIIDHAVFTGNLHLVPFERHGGLFDSAQLICGVMALILRRITGTVYRRSFLWVYFRVLLLLMSLLMVILISLLISLLISPWYRAVSCLDFRLVIVNSRLLIADYSWILLAGRR